jgi:predicted O-methyltransferase YrrM
LDLKERQISSREQIVVLRALAAAAARPGCKFLEVGSWCGDSTVVIARVAQDCGGHVFCVDWWKGNVGTELAEIASAEDVFAVFWERIRRLGLEDVVVPIRGPSELAAQVLAPGTFDLIFLDADHSYDGILNDIRHYAPLVRAGGILCGHDCEGRSADYDRAFLEAGKQVDFHESVHCGVVLAVGSSFAEHSLDYGIWSVRADGSGAWAPTDLVVPGIPRRRQPAPPPIGYSKSYNVIRYGRLVYAVPYSANGIDLAAVDAQGRAQLASAPSVRALEHLIAEKISPGSGPSLMGSYKHFNIIRHEERLFALAQTLGPVILPEASDDELARWQRNGDCVVGASLPQLKEALDRLVGPAPALSAAPRQANDGAEHDWHQRRQALAPTPSCKLQLVVNHKKPKAKISVILLDWGVRESFHSIHYLNQQTIPRDEYELIWVEFYDRKPAELRRLLEAAHTPLLDKWLVMGYPADVAYHKHRMYNAGIVLAEGAVCVFCDSDAIFEPTFIENVLQGFAAEPSAVIHLDEVRNYSKKFYPFNYPALDAVLGDGCVNWTGKTTTGLDDSPDMLHAANYGACMAARRDDLIRIGGADEHIDYLGYICGPYELTFRLVNFGRQERWLRNEYLYHVWHPNTSGCNVEYKGPDDGRGMSLRALEARECGRMEPYQENAAIRRLRGGARDSVETLLALLVRDDAAAWHLDTVLGEGGPHLIEQGYFGFNIVFYRGAWYGLSQKEGPFDPTKVRDRNYKYCFTAPTKAELLARLPVRLRWLQYQLVQVVRRLPYARRLRDQARRFLRIVRQRPVRPSDRNPQLIEENFYGFNIVYYRGIWYALGQDEGAFDPVKAHNRRYTRCFSARSQAELQALLPVGSRWLLRLPFGNSLQRLARRRPSHQGLPRHDEVPHLIEEGYLGFNILHYRDTWYGLGQDEGAFDPLKLEKQQYRRCLTAASLAAVKTAVRRQRTFRRRVKDLAKRVLGRSA